MSTYSAKPSEIQKKWILIDATDLVSGRLASEIAYILRGKHKPTFTAHMDCGDNVVVINAEKVHFTGNKLEDKIFYWHTGYAGGIKAALKDGKIYYRHTGYVGGIKETTAGKILAGKHPERVLAMAVRRMISRNPLGEQQYGNLYVYAGPEHPHAGQTPVAYDFGIKNRKNKK